MGKKNRLAKQGRGSGIVLHGGGITKGPQLKEGASQIMWEGAASYGVSKWVDGEIDKIYRKHNLRRAVVKVDEKKPADEGAAKDEIRALLYKVTVGGVFATRMFGGGDLAASASKAAVHQGAGHLATV